MLSFRYIAFFESSHRTQRTQGKATRGYVCDAIMYHMKTVSVRDLRYRFPLVEARLREGDPIAITKRKRVIARLVPEPRESVSVDPPDFMAILKRIYGNKKQKVSGAELVSMQRGDR
jgi:antitoxin (DNA-binding transcriptional repressor) of toxin-antitoxin stability system